jgi:hypothetical protein
MILDLMVATEAPSLLAKLVSISEPLKSLKSISFSGDGNPSAVEMIM